jgi:protein-tyrosine phosphatase
MGTLLVRRDERALTNGGVEKIAAEVLQAKAVLPGNATVQVLFVCLGNICRSPIAEGVFRHLVAEAGLDNVISTNSAGTGPWHVGRPPDKRGQATAARHEINIGHQRARQIAADDFIAFDYVLAMDGDNLKTLLRAAPTEHQNRVTLFLIFGATDKGGDVPDPHYGGPKGFDDVFVLVQDAARGLLRHIQLNDI